MYRYSWRRRLQRHVDIMLLMPFCTSHSRSRGVPVVNGAAVLVQVVGPCFDELNVRPGCECSTRACKAAIQPLVTQTCKRAILKIICDVADWLEPQLEANVRSMYLHVFNDCALGAQEGCNAVRSRPAQTALHR